MKKRLGISALVGAATFLAVYLVCNLIYARAGAGHTPHIPLKLTAVVYGTLFALINAAVTFGVSMALRKPAVSN